MEAHLKPIRFGRFLLAMRLAVGGMGEVFLAKLHGPAGFEKLLVIKRVLEALTDKPGFLDMFLSEARLAAKLTHRNIAQTYEMGRIEEHYYIAMEYVAGRSLRELMRRCRMQQATVPVAHAVNIAAQACDALAYAHAAADTEGPLHLIHRDISPRNILLSYLGDAKIIDFGIAKSRMSLETTAAGVIKGKLGYMSPEQSTARPIDKRSDQFSLGVVLYELCSGLHPFLEDDPLLTFDAIQRRVPPPLSRFDPALEPLDPIVNKALSKEPAERYADCGLMRRDLMSLLQEGKVSDPRQSFSEYLHEVFAAEVEEDRAIAREVSALALPLGSAGRLETAGHTVARSSFFSNSPLRPTVVGILAILLLVTFFGSVGFNAWGRRHREAANRQGVPATATDPPASTTVTTLSAPVAELERVVPERTPKPAEAAPPSSTPRREPPPVEDAPQRREPVVPRARAQPPPISRQDSQSRPAKTDVEKKERRPVGSLSISTKPTVTVKHRGRSTSRITLRSAAGRFSIGSGASLTGDPFSLRVDYEVRGEAIALTIHAKPWAIVQNEIGSGLGRTPVKVMVESTPLTLNLANPSDGRALSITASFSRP